jgi:hypothetical protein
VTVSAAFAFVSLLAEYSRAAGKRVKSAMRRKKKGTWFGPHGEEPEAVECDWPQRRA